MAPFLDAHGGRTSSQKISIEPRLVVIGAGSRGNAYARATIDSGLATIAAIVEPIDFKRRQLGSRYIWQSDPPSSDQEFSSHRDFIAYEQKRRQDEADGLAVGPGFDGIFICVRDELHTEVVTALAPLELHMMCEKPLATSLEDCLAIQKTLKSYPQRIFAIGHVLRYSPHNMLLRHLAVEKQVIGDILSIEHTEPVGWWHFSHSYVRGNWRKESATAPSLLTKSCHDIDWLLWMLCSPVEAQSTEPPHLPDTIASFGSLKQFRRSKKPKEAGSATNCLSCPIEKTCVYSAPRIYHDRHLAKANARWPVDIVNPEVETILHISGPEKAKQALMASLSEDYSATSTPVPDIEARPWFGRCVWESDNDVCDDQHVLFSWEADTGDEALEPRRGPKTASFHMIAQTQAQCARRGRIYGSAGEISYDSSSITVYSFEDDATRTMHPEVPKNSHHGGGDDGLTQQFVKAVAAVKGGEKSVADAQTGFLGVTLEEVVRSHAAVFAAEEARREGKVVRWDEWWQRNIGEIKGD